MGNCYGRRRSFKIHQDYINKDMCVQRKISANFSISKSPKKMGIDAELSGQLETTRQETYSNTIPSVLELVENDNVAKNQLLEHQQQLQISQ